MLRPKLLDTLKNYSGQQFLRDCLAGVIVGIVALPLAIAFGIASGVTPDKGLYTAIIAGFIISVLGGSRVQIGGPTGAFVIIVYGIIHQYGFPALLVATILAGIFLILMGVFRLGSVIKFIPHSVIVGFTAGIALVIAVTQLNDFLGLGIKNLPADFFEKISVLITHIHHTNPYAVMIALGTILLIVFWPTSKLKLPGSLIAILFASTAVALFKLPIETIGTRFGAIPSSLPMPVLPQIPWLQIQYLLKPAFTIAILAAIESLLSAVVADGMIGGRHRSNMELVAQGVANIVVPLFGGIPATGAIARTATNIKNGGRTPVAGIIHSLVLLLIILFFGKLVAFIPLACLAGILMTVAYNMSEWRSVRSIMKTSKTFGVVLLTTFILTVVVDLTAAIEVGLVLASLIFIKEMTESTSVSTMSKALDVSDEGSLVLHETELSLNNQIPEGCVVYEINGPMFFGAAYKFKEAISELGGKPRFLVLRMRHVPMIDSTGVHIIKEALARFSKDKTQFIFVGVQPKVYKTFTKANVVKKVGAKNFVNLLSEALKLVNA
jgi:SulP family sulfate permease